MFALANDLGWVVSQIADLHADSIGERRGTSVSWVDYKTPVSLWILMPALRRRFQATGELRTMWETEQRLTEAMPAGTLTLHTLSKDAEHALAKGPHPEKARRDAETLLLYSLRNSDPGKTLASLIAHKDDKAPADSANAMRALVERRLRGEPIQYITGETEFYRLPIAVNRDVLIPRPETELLVERAVELARVFSRPRVLDVGTGSGAIAIAVAHELPDAQVTATEISQAALKVAQRNADRNQVAIRFLHGDLLRPVSGEQFEIIVSNPPYVPQRDRDSLSVEVREFEPAQALFAGKDGLAVYRRLIPAAFAALVSGGFVALEIGYSQKSGAAALLAESGFAEIDFAPDLQGIPRVASARRP